MTSLTEFFSRQEDDNLKGISHKNNLFKRNIIAHMAMMASPATVPKVTAKVMNAVRAVRPLERVRARQALLRTNM